LETANFIKKISSFELEVKDEIGGNGVNYFL